MNYKQTLNYLYTQLPMFQRIGAAAYKADLNNTLAICKLLHNPENKFKSIHVAGTNGKGSTSHMLAAVFQQAGYKTGLYTSPHLKDFRERIKINGKEIPKKHITDFVEKYKNDFEKIEPSFFEWTVGLAFNYFAEEKVDIAIIEVGLGGRLDSTNVVMPLLSLITNISYDHTNLLGNTLPKIAKEKAGIIKPKVPVVISQTQSAVKKVFIEKAKTCKSKIYYADTIFIHQKENYLPKKSLTKHSYNKDKERFSVLSDLPGTYQKYNIAGVLTALDVLKHDFKIKDKHIAKALANVKKLTGLHGRWELLNKHPRVIADTGHNKDGILQVMKSVNREFESGVVKGKLHVVFGAVNDKDITSIFTLLKTNKHFSSATYYFCKPNIPRGMELDVLYKAAKQVGLKGKTYPSVKEALSAAKKTAKANELIFVGGSTFTVAEV
ncbi:MAG TPA: folylpolyglutamate synthase/dihydrofolate synthase family protein [Bacteroidia bacterium]|jgi:dihydrofolate synthase/folylpolyglutamate synthase|nr:folylpolyglutamate synthase/dihydrofolate synthase family protein [Bacteroidia bacterium]